MDRARERIASNGRWTLVWQNGEELNVAGLALDHETDKETGGWGITDGSAGLRGRLIKTDNLAEVKLYVAALLSGAADVFTDRRISDFGLFALPSLQNAPLKGAQSVLDRYARQILQTIERDGFYVRVPAGKELTWRATFRRTDLQGCPSRSMPRWSFWLSPETHLSSDVQPFLAVGLLSDSQWHRS